MTISEFRKKIRNNRYLFYTIVSFLFGFISFAIRKFEVDSHNGDVFEDIAYLFAFLWGGFILSFVLYRIYERKKNDENDLQKSGLHRLTFYMIVDIIICGLVALVAILLKIPHLAMAIFIAAWLGFPISFFIYEKDSFKNVNPFTV